MAPLKRIFLCFCQAPQDTFWAKLKVCRSADHLSDTNLNCSKVGLLPGYSHSEGVTL